MSPSESPIKLAIADGIASIMLNRPEHGNAIDLALARGLADVATTVDARNDVRCVLLSAEGRFFCVGGDLQSFADAGSGTAVLMKKVTSALHAAISCLARMSKPLVVAVNGPAAGAGIGLAALGDIVLAGQSSHFTLAYTAAGLTPDAGATALLPGLIGLRRTQELLLTNRRVPAAEAAEIGLVTRVVEDSDLKSEAAATAGVLAQGPISAFGAVRRLLQASSALEVQLEREARAISEAAAGAEGREGILAFVAKRKPDFSRIADQA